MFYAFIINISHQFMYGYRLNALLLCTS